MCLIFNLEYRYAVLSRRMQHWLIDMVKSAHRSTPSENPKRKSLRFNFVLLGWSSVDLVDQVEYINLGLDFSGPDRSDLSGDRSDRSGPEKPDRSGPEKPKPKSRCSTWSTKSTLDHSSSTKLVLRGFSLRIFTWGDLWALLTISINQCYIPLDSTAYLYSRLNIKYISTTWALNCFSFAILWFFFNFGIPTLHNILLSKFILELVT